LACQPRHVLVIPKAHAAYLNDLEEDIEALLLRVAMSINKALRKSGLECEGVNLFLADGEIADQEILHARLHVFPRFVNDVFRLKFGPHY
jgi:histidine triad (HIT) family protein